MSKQKPKVTGPSCNVVSFCEAPGHKSCKPSWTASFHDEEKGAHSPAMRNAKHCWSIPADSKRFCSCASIAPKKIACLVHVEKQGSRASNPCSGLLADETVRDENDTADPPRAGEQNKTRYGGNFFFGGGSGMPQPGTWDGGWARGVSWGAFAR